MNNSIVKSKEEAKKLLILATLAGQIMLKSGAETYRVEDTITRICKSKNNIKFAEAFVIPTGIFISMEYEDNLMSYIKRIKSISIDLNKIDMVNEFSRRFVSENLNINESFSDLKEINKSIGYKKVTKNLFGAFACGFFTLLFKGSLGDALGSFLSSFVALSILSKFLKYKLTFFLNNIIGSIIMSILSIIFLKINLGQSLDIMIIGSIMCLVPGVSITNAVRDTMSGDYLSGLSIGMEAVFSALSIALGVGIILSIYSKGVF